MNYIQQLSLQYCFASFCLHTPEFDKSCNLVLVLLFLLLFMPIISGKLLKPCSFENMKYYANKKAQMTATIFTRFLKVLDASLVVHGRNILLSAYNSAVHLQDTSFLQNVKFVYFSLNFTSVMLCTRIGYGWMLRRMSASVHTLLWPLSLPHLAFPV